MPQHLHPYVVGGQDMPSGDDDDWDILASYSPSDDDEYEDFP